MKSRGVYETPGGTILHAAHRAIESLTLDREAAHLKDSLMPRYAELIYYGFWFSPEREMLQALIDKSQEHVEGEVRLKLYKGNVIVTGRIEPEIALLRARSSPSRTTPAPTTRRTPKASSSSTRCGCGSSANGSPSDSIGGPMWPDTRLLDLFGIELPIVQAPMANATGVEMAVAVAKAGGLGSLPCAMLGTDKMRAGVTEFRAQSNRPINLNFFCHASPPRM